MTRSTDLWRIGKAGVIRLVKTTLTMEVPKTQPTLIKLKKK